MHSLRQSIWLLGLVVLLVFAGPTWADATAGGVVSADVEDQIVPLGPVGNPPRADLELYWFTIDCGGGASYNANGLELSGTIGQPDAGVLTSGDLELTGGFWFAAPPTMATLKLSVPQDTRSLWRSGKNAILLTFDGDIELPKPCDILIRQLRDNGNYGVDMSANFTVSLEDEFGNADTTKLLIKETGTALGNTLWIGVQNIGDWANVQPFTLRYAVQVGDVNNDGRVMSNDLSPIFPMIPTAGASATERRDINGDGRVMSNDLSPVFPNIPSAPVPKPTGHGL
ncbi:MAG: hypothetical protein KAV82_08035 [Phycisphaerae bacterium]|nr:hypothetical protein [Phycisphaerae bacterium]